MAEVMKYGRIRPRLVHSEKQNTGERLVTCYALPKRCTNMLKERLILAKMSCSRKEEKVTFGNILLFDYFRS